MKEKFTQHEKYRQSEQEYLPKIPAHWSVMRIKYLFKEINERVFNETLDLLSVSHYTGVTLRKSSVSEGDNLTNAKSLEGYKRVEKDDIVSNIMLAWNGSIGISKYLGITSPAYSIYRLKKEGNPNYFHYLFRTQLYKSEFKKNSTGVIESRLRLYTDQFFNINAIVPPPQEQTAIADFLDQKTAEIDNYIRLKEKTIALLEERKAAVINRAVTKGLDPTVPMKDSGIEWLGEIPAHWEVKKLKYLVRIENGQVDPKKGKYKKKILIAPNHIQSGFGTIKYLESAESQNAESGKYLAKEGTVIYSKIRPALRKACIAPEECLCSADMYPLNTTSKIVAGFLLYTVISEVYSKYMIELSMRVAMPKVNRGDVLNYPAILPPLEEQVEIASFVKKKIVEIDKLIETIRIEEKQIKEYRESLISAAVTGKIDIRNYHLKTAENVETARN